jgi:hypothetical protein
MTATASLRPDGARLFTRFAYPPNALGLCGPADSAALLEYGASDVNDGGLRRLARDFDGAWPYLQLIAAANGIPDALDRRVVEAYWLGNTLLDRIPVTMLGSSLEERFRHRAGAGWGRLAEVLEAGGSPHHNFHVFAVYPWVGLLERGTVDEPLRVLDRCRIRWGRVEDVIGDEALVRGRGLVWTGSALAAGEPRVEAVAWRRGGRALIAPPRRGDWVAMHWDWLCDVLTPTRRRALREQTARQLALVNSGIAHPGPAAVLA